MDQPAPDPSAAVHADVTGAQSTEEQYRALRAEVERHARAYYELDAPEIPDDVYDRMVRELRAIEELHPEWAVGPTPTGQVGGAPSGAFQHVNHPTPMTSLDNVFDDEELAEWQEKLARALNLPPTTTASRTPGNSRSTA